MVNALAARDAEYLLLPVGRLFVVDKVGGAEGFGDASLEVEEDVAMTVALRAESIYDL